MEETRVNISLDSEVHAKLHALANRDGRIPLAAVIARAIEEKFRRDVIDDNCCPGFAAIGSHDETCKDRKVKK